MNLVVLNIDTVRTDLLGVYGGETVETPNLDAFGSASLVFDESYAASFPTIPCRTDLFTGRFGEPFHPWLPLNFVEPTLPALLSLAGWPTQLIFDCPHLMQGGHGFDRPFSAWDFIRGAEVDCWWLDDKPVTLPVLDDRIPPLQAQTTHAQYVRNWSRFETEEDTHTAQLCDSACRWLERNQRHEHSLLWIESFAPHEPWLPPRHDYLRYLDGPDVPVPLAHVTDVEQLSPEEVHCLWARYAGFLSFVDRHVGRIFDKLVDLGRLEDTCIVVMSDHGTYLGDHGRTCTKGGPFVDGIAQLMTMVHLPGGPRNGQRTSAIIQPPDLMPTLLDLVELEIPENCQGKSYRGVLEGSTDVHRDAAITATLPAGRKPVFHAAVRQDGWCLCEGPNEPGGGRWRTYRELFHTPSDPEQVDNVIDQHPDVADRLRQRLIQHLREHEAAPQLERMLLTGDPGDLSDWRATKYPVPGYHPYWKTMYRTPEPWLGVSERDPSAG